MENQEQRKIEGGKRVRGRSMARPGNEPTRSEPTRNEPPLVSIIMVVKNAGEAITETIESVLRQPSNDYELIVVDGASEDGTVDILRSYDDGIEYWMSEPDRGVYDATNKAEAMASGQFLFHLNLGDTLLQIPAQELRESWEEGAALVSFRVLLDHRDIFVPRQDWRLRLTNTLHHQGTFYRRDASIPYDLAYQVFADFDVNQKMTLSRRRVRLFDAIVANHSTDGLSHSSRRFYEVFQIIRKNHGFPYVFASYGYFKLQGLKRRIRMACGV
jgi:glycosyltransferase involved in cell wall biosynthesis